MYSDRGEKDIWLITIMSKLFDLLLEVSKIDRFTSKEDMLTSKTL
jgi:hypothetical protein